MAGDHKVVQWLDAEKRIMVFLRDRRRFHQRGEMREAWNLLFARHVRQFAKGIRVAHRPELVRRRTLHQMQAALHIVPTASLPTIIAGKQTSAGIEFQAEVVATAFGEDLETMSLGVVAPHHAALKVDAGSVRRVDSRSRHVATCGASLSAIQPTIHPPHQSVRNRVRVFHAEALQVDEQEVRRGRRQSPGRDRTTDKACASPRRPPRPRIAALAMLSPS